MNVDFINVENHHNFHISGWLRAGGEYLYFEVEDLDKVMSEPNSKIVYRIFKQSNKTIKTICLSRIRSFRHNVYWYWAYKPVAGKWYHDQKKSILKSSWADWYATVEEKFSIDDVEFKKGLILIGKSKDLITIQKIEYK